MRYTAIFSFIWLVFVSCSENEGRVDNSDSEDLKHREAINVFGEAQLSFKKLVGKVRDVESFDAAEAGLNEVVSEFDRAAEMMRELEPVPVGDGGKYLKVIEDGNSRSEPTGEDMISLLTLEEREAEVAAWLERFVASIQLIRSEIGRLYVGLDSEGAEIGAEGE